MDFFFSSVVFLVSSEQLRVHIYALSPVANYGS